MKRPILRASFLLHKFQRVEVLHLGGKGDREAGGVKALDRRHAAGAGQQLPPHLGSGIADTAYQPQAGDYYSAVGLTWIKRYLPPFAFFSM